MLSVILITGLAGAGVAPASVPESELHVVEGEVASYGAETLVLLTGVDDRMMTFDLARVTEAPAPLVSGAHVRVEFVEGATTRKALVVYLAPQRRPSS